MKTSTMNATTIQRICFECVQDRIMSAYNLSEEAYWHLEFEYGCLFAEHVVKADKLYRDSLLMDCKNGFWNWWRYQWRLDNQQLMDAGMIGPERYSDLKKAMCSDSVLTKRLLDFLSI